MRLTNIMEPAPRRRSTRRAVTNPKEKAQPVKSLKWTVADKKNLLQGINLYGIDRSKDIMTEFVQTKTVDQINQFIRTYQMRAKSQYKKLSDQPIEIKAPIEMWLALAEELTRFDNDYSFVISRVLSIMGNLEPHDGAYTQRYPDWSLLYKYLAATLAGSSDLPKLSAIEAVVLVDLIQSLADLLKELDLEKQSLLMKRKYALLSSIVNNRDRAAVMQQLQLALVNDPLEEITSASSREQQPPSATTSQAAAGSSTEPQTPSATTSQATAASSSTSSPPAASTSTSASALDLTKKSSSSFVDLTSLSPTDGVPTTPSANRNPSSTSSANQNSPTLSTNPISSSSGAANQSTSSTPTPGKSRKRGRSSKSSTDKDPAIKIEPPHRSELHSINPFCVPVKYLRPAKLQKDIV